MIRTQRLDEDFESVVYAPTGTSSDALEAATQINKQMNDDDWSTNAYSLLNAGYKDGTGQDLAVAEFADIYQGWRRSVAPGAAILHVSGEIAGHVNDTADTVPEPHRMDEVLLPKNGLVLFGDTLISDRSSGHYVGDDYHATALTWEFMKSPEDGSPLLTVTPWCSLRSTTTSPITVSPGQLIPAIPAWIDGEAPRKAAVTRSAPGEILEDWNRATALHWIRYVTALGAWVNSLADVEQTVAARSTRKRYRRTTNTEPETVTSVKLRKVEHLKHVETGPVDSDGREYSHRWIVSSHWRKQPCGPGRKLRRNVLVAPYVKGPADKPLVLKDRIWKVDR